MKRFSRTHIAAYPFYLGVAIIITWPLAQDFSTRLLGHAFGDSYEYIHHVWWIKHALQTGQPLFFQPLLAYPDGLPGAGLWSLPLLTFPAWLFAFVLPLPAAFNLQALLTLALNGWAVYWLVWKLTGQRSASLLAGVVFEAYPAMQGQLAAGHVGLLVLWPAPLYFYVLLRIRETGDPRWLGLGALLFVLSLSGNSQLPMFVIFPMTALLALSLLIEWNWRWLRRVMLVALVGGALSLIFILPTVFELLPTPLLLREGGEITYSADLLTIITPSFQHPVFGSLDYTHRILGEDPFETPGYIGILAAGLAAVALWKRREARWWLALAAIAWVFSLGPLLKVMGEPVRVAVGEYESYITLPWAAFHDLPIVNITRTPARFNLLVGLALALMAGYGAAHLLTRRRMLEDIRLTGEGSPLEEGWSQGGRRLQPASSRLTQTLATGLPASGGKYLTNSFRGQIMRWSLLALAIAIILWEYQLFWNGMSTSRGVVPDPIAALSQREDVRAVLDMPWEHPLTDKDAMFLQTGHQQPLLAGHISRRTPVNPARLTLLQSTLDPALLDEAGVDIIILHKQWDDAEGALEDLAHERLGDPFFENGRIAAWEAPQANDEPQFITLVTPAETVTDTADSYLYAPEAGWVTVSGQIAANGRAVELLLDGQQVHEWMVEQDTAVRVPLFVDAGYHTVTLALQPPCPEQYNPALRCRALSLHDVTLDNFTPAALSQPILLERGVQLLASHIERNENRLDVWLQWRFDQPLTELDVHFVHVLDEARNMIAQADTSLGERPSHSGWAESLEIWLPDDLPTGTYTVYTGWYTNPDVTRFTVFSDTPGAQDGLISLGTFEVE